MRSFKRWNILSWSVLASFVVLFMFLCMTSAQIARGDDAPTSIYTRFATPLPSPMNNGGKATWTVKQMSLVSHFPKGFDMILDAKSSSGRIILAKVKWRHSTIRPKEMNVSPDANGKFVAHWTPNIYDILPQWAGVDYWWVLTDEKGYTYETPHGYDEYADNTRKWSRLVSEDAVIHWESSLPAQIGPQVADALKKQRDTYQLMWGKLLNYKPHIIVYASYTPWKEWETDLNDQWVEGQASPEWGSVVQIYNKASDDPLKELTYGVVLHEIEHLYQETFSPYDTYTKQVWFYEGDAAYLELQQMYDYLQTVKSMAARGNLPRLQKEPALALESHLPYEVGYSVWKYLEVTFGPDTHRKVWERIAKGLPIEQALEQATGKKFFDIENGFRAWLGASPLPTPGQ